MMPVIMKLLSIIDLLRLVEFELDCLSSLEEEFVLFAILSPILELKFELMLFVEL